MLTTSPNNAAIVLTLDVLLLRVHYAPIGNLLETLSKREKD